MRLRSLTAALLAAAGLGLPAPALADDAPFDVVIRGGTVYDGTGAPGRRADVGIRGDRIAAVGDLSKAPRADRRGRDRPRRRARLRQHALLVGRHADRGRKVAERDPAGRHDRESSARAGRWVRGTRSRRSGPASSRATSSTTSSGRRSPSTCGTSRSAAISPNVASFVGAATVRENVIGLENRAPTPAELEKMQALVRQEMEAGALGVGTALIYPPGTFATTEELIALCKVAARVQGEVHLPHAERRRPAARGDRRGHPDLARGGSARRDLPLQGGRRGQLGQGRTRRSRRSRRRAARASGSPPTCTRTRPAARASRSASRRGRTRAAPPELLKRLQDPETRARIAREMREPGKGWENLYRAAGPDRILLVEFAEESLKPLTGKTLGEVAKAREQDPVETSMDLVVEGKAMIGALYFLMSEENVARAAPAPVGLLRLRRRLDGAGGRLPEVLDAPACLRQLRALPRQVRPRARSWRRSPEAIRRLSGLPAENLGLDRRGLPRSPAPSPTSSSSIRRRSPTGRPTRSRTSTPSACATSSSTACRC